MPKKDDPMRRCPCQSVRDRCDAEGQRPLFDLSDLLTNEEREAIEAKRVEDEMFKPRRDPAADAGPDAVGRPRESTAPSQEPEE